MTPESKPDAGAPGAFSDKLDPASGDKPDATRPETPSEPTPRVARLFVRAFWWMVLVLTAVLFSVVIRISNQFDLSALPAAGLLRLGVAVGLSLLVLGLPYLIWRSLLDRVREQLMLQRDAELAVKDARRRLRSYGDRLSAAARTQVEDATRSLEEALAVDEEKPGWADGLTDALTALDHALTAHLSFARKSALREYAESIGVAVLIALFLRAFVVEAFKIPSGSMLPTLEVGDHIFVNKFMYGVRVPGSDLKLATHVREPRRGEVIVFVYPVDPEKDFIKRIVGIPGDTVEVCGGQVKINGQPLRREPVESPCEYDDFDEDRPSGSWHKVECVAYREWNGSESYRTVHNQVTAGLPGACSAPVTVPKDKVFVMGDNRDNSHDSRYWGFVPYALIKGKAWFIWWSAGERSSVRMGRMFSAIHR